MDHKEIQEKILLYFDGDLSAIERDNIKEHLISCSFCSKRLESFSKIWRIASAVERMKPSPYLWTRLEERIRQYERNRYFFTDISERFGLLLRPAVFVLLFFLAVIMGNYLGNSTAITLSVDSKKGANEEVTKIFHMDVFDPFPPESIGKVLTIASN